MFLRSLRSRLVVINFGCMVRMGNTSSSSSSSSSSSRTRDDSYYNDNNIADVSITCIKNHLKSGRPAKEFMILENEEPTCDDTLTEAQKICNKEKNRYINILPCDSTRVRLSPIAGVDGSDYINANFIDGDGSDRAYIATQGPLMHTRGDFWRMVWENNSTIVVMLGKEKENDRVKVDRYWPEEGEPPLRFYNLQIELVDKVYDAELSIAVRRLLLTYLPPLSVSGNGNDSRGKEVRSVIHYQYEGWPDHGVPSSAAPIRQLVRVIEQERSQTSLPSPSPMVVHCSAGVGRTGTFVTIHMTLLRLFHELRDSGNNPFLNLNHSTNSINGKTVPSAVPLSVKFNLYNTVLKLRRQRPGMVQQQEQYVFCYEAVAEEAEQLGLIPSSPVVSRSPRLLSVSTSSLPSPSTPLRTSTSSYVASPTSVPTSPNFLESSGYLPNFLNNSTSSLSSAPPSPYITSLDCSTPALFPPIPHPHETLSQPVDCHQK